MKKLLLSLGAIAAVVAPVATVVACGSSDAKPTAPVVTPEATQTHISKDGSFSISQIDEMVAKAKTVGTIKDEAAFRNALAKQTLETINTFKTSDFITMTDAQKQALQTTQSRVKTDEAKTK